MAGSSSRRPRSARPSTAPENPRHPLLPPSMLSASVEADEHPVSLTINLDSLPPPFPLQPTAPRHPEGADWSQFITSYACGRWAPQTIPRPPSQLPVATKLASSVPSGALAFERTRPPPPPPSHRLRASFSAVSSTYKSPPSTSSYPAFALPGVLPSTSGSFPAAQSSAAAFTITAANVVPSSISAATNHLDAQTSAATLRWAGSRVRVAPLALPSPEHELVDPMRNAGAVPIPGSHPDFATAPRPRPSQSTAHSRSTSISRSYASVLPHLAHPHPVQTPGWDVMTPGGTRRARLSGFWSGTVDVEESTSGSEWLEGPSILPALEGSPTVPELDSDGTLPASGSSLLGTRPPPATAPIPSVEDVDEGEWDYFALGRGGSSRMRRRAGLNTPPSTREGSASRPESDYGGATPQKAPMATQTPKTPDSNPKRPSFTHTLSAPATTSLQGSFGPLPPEEPPRPELHVAIGEVDVKIMSPDEPVDEPLPVPAPTILDASYQTSSPSSPLPSPALADTDPSIVPTEGPSPTSLYSGDSPTYTSPDAHPVLAHASDAIADMFGASVYQPGQEPQSHSVPAIALRRNLMRQASAPLPVSTSITLSDLMSAPRARSTDSAVESFDASNARLILETESEPGNDYAPDLVAEPQATTIRRSAKEDARAAREERAFAQRGFLAPPFPPDELGRRRALYKFNIVNTGSDLNFDRIAHLAKLVFNTKGVLISVVDEAEEWFKSEWGMNKMHGCARSASFGAHAILQRGDEPMIVLDSQLDWRFAKSPLVVGAPHIRFYAGAPLRTQDGFNIGCLALVDDSPREDFTPRQRHTLKEFAAIAMREMELWRDKIRLRIRDRIQNSMEQFSRECLEIDESSRPAHGGESVRNSRRPSPSPEPSQRRRDPSTPAIVAAVPVPPPPELLKDSSSLQPPAQAPATESPPIESPHFMGPASSMDTVYDHAAKLVQRTLDVDGVVVIDVSHCEVLETMSSEASVSVVLHNGAIEAPTRSHTLTVDEYQRLNEFFAKYPEGKVSEGIVPPPFRMFLPQAHIQYALIVPIYNIDKRPFALLCAWNASDQTKRFLEGHELSYLRAIGVIILSAVLKRRMILADKAKSLFISNISHELRTPLHGILAAAELLGDSSLNHSQMSFLQTVQACGTSLVETVNHVLDFTKLSGNSKAGGVENVIVPSRVDLMQLVEEAVDGCFIGHRARTVMGDSGIGSVYSPPEERSSAKQLVETVVEIGWRKAGWGLKCEKGGIRRVLMNVFGNSLKFTTNGYVHVVLREIPRSSDDPVNETKVELVVADTGKGISEKFRKEQLFHPFSQENPLQTGTGLGLAIVNSIVRSESVNGKLDVFSEEGVGTEIKITFTATTTPDEPPAPEMEPFRFEDPSRPATLSLVGFDLDHKGVQLLHDTIQTYAASWWGFEVRPARKPLGDIVILNEDVELVKKATAERDIARPFIILSTLHGNPTILATVADYENIGGFCRVIYKPGGPSRLYALLKLALHAVKIEHSSAPPSRAEEGTQAEVLSSFGLSGNVIRRNSHESGLSTISRPLMSPRASTIHPISSASWRRRVPSIEERDSPPPESEDSNTITIGVGTLLKASVGTVNPDQRRFRVLVVEDNNVLRMLLIKWLTTKASTRDDYLDGRRGVSVYKEEGPFDVVLLDMSMPILDGIGATTEIRQLEAQRLVQNPGGPKGIPTRILALTGRSSLEDKRLAFDAGVDGYLVKPISFKTLEEFFSKLSVP
ncbi:Histidine kinase [Mycena kentingensis (nom. inval.)]|nr:Histidine kinase [Mycena kentingensis (nom. inval.)]